MSTNGRSPAERQLELSFEAPPPDLITRLRGFGVSAARPISLHRNARVMVSVNATGALRVHEGYRAAPDEVVRALAGWARPRATRRERREHARVFLAFSVHGDAPPKRRRRPDRPEPGDEGRIVRLEALHAELNRRWFGGSLRTIPIELSGRMRRKLGHYELADPGPAVIVISRRHLRRDGWAGVSATLLHEMVHQWQDETGRPVDHRAGFWRKAEEVGVGKRRGAVD